MSERCVEDKHCPDSARNTKASAKPEWNRRLDLNDTDRWQYVACLPIRLYFNLYKFLGEKKKIAPVFLLALACHHSIFLSGYEPDVRALGRARTADGLAAGEMKFSVSEACKAEVIVTKHGMPALISTDSGGSEHIAGRWFLAIGHQMTDVPVKFLNRVLAERGSECIDAPIPPGAVAYECEIRSIGDLAEARACYEVPAGELYLAARRKRGRNPAATLDLACVDRAFTTVLGKNKPIRVVIRKPQGW